MCDGKCERVGMHLHMAASGANLATHAEMRGEESDARCDLNACGGYDSGTCDGGSSTTASEMGERAATRRDGRRRGKQRGTVSRGVRRAVAAKARLGMEVVASDDDE